MSDDSFDKLLEDSASRVDVYQRRFDELKDQPVSQFEWAKRAAILGVPEAIGNVVEAYQFGRGVEPSQNRAFEWMYLAAELLHLEKFYYDYALAYRDGAGTVRDIAKFVKWMSRAAESTDPTEAMYHLAKAQQDGSLASLPSALAVDWTSKMAHQGAPGAMIQLARRYRDGSAGVEKSLDRFLEWSQKAVAAAKPLWLDARQGLLDTGKGNFTYEDYPEALSTLAEAQRRANNASDALKRDREAAIEAAKAMKLAIRLKQKAGWRLTALMLKRLSQMRTSNGVKSGDRAPYFRWQSRIGAATLYAATKEDGISPMPSPLVDALVELALAHKEGVGTHIDVATYEELLGRAVDEGSGKAAFLQAEESHARGDLLEFDRLINVSAEANNIQGQTSKELFSCGVSATDYPTVLTALNSLRACVDQIRNTRHVVTQDDAKDGIAHYTDDRALANMLGSGADEPKNRIRLYNIALVNDPKEGKRLPDHSPDGYANPLRTIFADSSTAPISWLGKDFQVFIACFSLRCDSLNLWRFYGRDGTGYGVVSPLSAFDAASAQGLLRGAWSKEQKVAPQVTLYKVLYQDTDARQALDDLSAPVAALDATISSLDSEVQRNVKRMAAAIISELLFLYKDRHYEHEEEVRAVQARSLGDPELKLHPIGGGPFGRLYVETRGLLFQETGSAIVVGPKVPDHAAVMLDIKHRLARQNWSQCGVERSAISYR